MDLDVGAVVGERYTIQGRLGEGGMAVVYQVVHNQLGTHHALKVLSLTARNVRDRMLQEGRFQAKLRHPNIVAVTDVVAVDRSPALVMELVDGMPLDELLRMQKLTIEQADAIGRGVLAGVAHAHALGLIHRDLKPANVMLEIVNQSVTPKVTDFGLAKLLDGQEDDGRPATRTGSSMGTPQYMSPEQIKDAKNVDARADVFACAALLYELLAGERAFDGENVLEIFQRIDRGTYRDPHELRPDAPARMVEAIRAGLVGDRELRVQTATELYALWTGGETLSAPPPAATLGTLPSLEEFRAAPPTTAEPTSAPSMASMAPMVMLGGSFAALVVAAVVILVLVGAVAFLYTRPAETIVRVETKPVLVPVPGEAPVAEEVEPTEAPVAVVPEPGADDGLPWDVLVAQQAASEAAAEEVADVDEAPPVPDVPEVVAEPEAGVPDAVAEPEVDPTVPYHVGLADAFLQANNLIQRTAMYPQLLKQWRAGPIPEERAAAVLRAVTVPKARADLLEA
ncbi:MAG: serine/threonine protein kinase, partial [Myxococcales bacterium]|nr:serine/threonine protein kinase [Myxococcales bacterium]